MYHSSTSFSLYKITKLPFIFFFTPYGKICLIMKVHQFTRGLWEHEPSLTLGCKRLRPLAPKFCSTTDTTTITTTATTTASLAPFDLKSFIKPESGSRKLGFIDDNNSNNSSSNKRDSPSSPQGQVETHPGGTRWNPTQEQIGILEMLYKGGMRTPNAQQIEQITVQLGKYGKIEGKNVFYWFQNHKARERQKQKRNSLGLSHTPRTPSTTTSSTILVSSPTTFATTINFDTIITTRGEVVERDNEDSPYKKCRNWAFEYMEDQSWSSSNKDEDHEHKTLELFPLHPEGR